MSWFIALCLAVFSTTTLAAKPLIILAADPWCPWDCQSVQEQGFAVDIARAIFEPLGYQVDFVALPWARAIEQAKTGSVNAVIGADKISEEVKGFVFPDTPVGVAKNVYAISSKSDFKYTSNDALKGLKIGIVAGYHFGGDLGKYIDDHYQDKGVIEQISGTNAGEQNLKMVIAERIKMYVDDIHVVNYLIAKNNLQDKIKVGGALGDAIEAYIAFSPALPDSKKMATEFDAGMKQLKESGELTKILKRYNVNEVSGS